ncbi:MAG: hypothetical protein WC285_04155 [Candidatus Gracilibacteria bacterium]|jgi:hypothetical protein
MDAKAKNRLVEAYARGKENNLIEAYIVAGPTELRKTMGLNKAEFAVIFDYLAFEHDLLYRCVTQNVDFFVDLYVKYGMKHVRAVLEIEAGKYDSLIDDLFKLIAIANEGLYLNVLQNRARYLLAFKARGAEFLRRILDVADEKYDFVWKRVLDILLNAACDGLFSERTLDHGLKNFSMMMNGMREHRPILK